eukprot:scaffold347976_cov47-Prasinocladus_malaysianus.AAC.1
MDPQDMGGMQRNAGNDLQKMRMMMMRRQMGGQQPGMNMMNMSDGLTMEDMGQGGMGAGGGRRVPNQMEG